MTPRRPYSGPSRGPSRRIDEPQPGYFKLRLCKGGPWLAAVIRVENSKDEDGRLADRPRLVLRFAERALERGAILRWWPSLNPIPEEEYRRLCGRTLPGPADQPIQLSMLPPIF